MFLASSTNISYLTLPPTPVRRPVNFTLRMERSPIKDVEIKVLLKAALTDKVSDREVYMKGIDASYHYEGYNVFKTENIKNE